jgi:hypothetical protein
MFQETLKFWEIIFLPHNKQTIVKPIVHMPPPLTWHISQIIVDCISLLMYVYVLNQSCDHWLLSDALHHELQTKGRSQNFTFYKQFDGR